jgi:three-Cys-motif partner protein
MAEQVIRPWTQAKLDLLDKYLRAYSRIMQAQKQRGWLRSYAFVDAFANEGVYIDADQASYVDGSPRVALQCEPPFDECWFIELRSDRLTALQANVADLPASARARFVEGDANDVLTNQVLPAMRYTDYKRGLVFLDPYGTQVAWETVRQLAEAKAFDLFINFPIMGVNRLLDRDRRPDDHTLKLLERMTGDSRWAVELYTEQIDLFGESRYSRPVLRALELANLYMDRVRGLFGHASRLVVMTNSTNTPLYALFLASHKDVAVEITNDIFGQYERLPRRV